MSGAVRALGSRLLGWPHRSLGGRIVALFLGLVLVLQLLSFIAMGASVTRHARSQLPGQLDIGERVLQSLLDQQANKLAEGARLLASDDGFRSAVLSNDARAIASVLANHGSRIGASEVALLGTDHSLRAATGHDVGDLKALVGRLRPVAEASASNAEIALLGGQPHQVVLVPMRAPVLVGWVVMSVPLDAGLPQQMNALSALNVTFLTRGRPGESWVNALSSLPAEQAEGLARAEWLAGRNPSSEPSGLRSLSVGREELGVRARWLTPVDEATPVGARSAVVAVVSLSVDAAVRPPRDLEASLLGVTLVGFLLAVGGSLMTGRRVAQPLQTLAGAAERLGSGDYDSPMPELGRSDEIGHLAQAFEGMRASVAEKQQQILQLAYWDPLTALPNRVQFRNAVHQAIQQAQAGGHTVAVVMLDLDRFKHVNDVLGYHFGDLLLKQVAQRLSEHSVRGDDLVARLGGDEFAVLLRQGSAALADTVAQRIGKAFEQPLILQEHTVDMGAGIGMACWPQHAADADVLLSRAEVAMYAAKRRTAGPLMYDASIDAGSAQTLSLLTEMRHAVDHGELCLYLQPKLSLDSGRVSGAEALVRWQHPQRGLVLPMEFIPFAEQTGFVRVLTLWVFEAAAKAWLALRGDGLSLPLSVNLSTRDLLDQELPQKFDALLVKHRVPAEAFCLEITESAIMDDPQRALATLNRLSGLGFKLSIDDFGTGYSSLAYLKRLPVDELKIDKSFVMSMEKDAEDAKIVRSTIDLAHNLGLTVVAEGVENAKVWDLLRELECDQAQGYHMGKPMPVEQFQLWSAGWLARYAPASLVQSAVLH